MIKCRNGQKSWSNAETGRSHDQMQKWAEVIIKCRNGPIIIKWRNGQKSLSNEEMGRSHDQMKKLADVIKCRNGQKLWSNSKRLFLLMCPFYAVLFATPLSSYLPPLSHPISHLISHPISNLIFHLISHPPLSVSFLTPPLAISFLTPPLSISFLTPSPISIL